MPVKPTKTYHIASPSGIASLAQFDINVPSRFECKVYKHMMATIIRTTKA